MSFDENENKKNVRSLLILPNITEAASVARKRN
jgi:hypothetical protein